MSFDRVTIEDYGPIRSAELKLTRLHALIGPNDSGKSSILRAVRLALTYASGKNFFVDPQGHWRPFDGGIGAGFGRIALHDGSIAYAIQGSHNSVLDLLELNGVSAVENNRSPDPNHAVGGWLHTAADAHLLAPRGPQPTEFPTNRPQVFASNDAARLLKVGVATDHTAAFRSFATGLMPGCRFLRLNAEKLREPSKVLPLDAAQLALHESGTGLAAILDALRDRGDDRYDAVRASFLELFPTVKFLQLQATSPGSKQLAIELRDGTVVPAKFMSEGMLLFLAFATLQHIAPASAILVEEPENGLHPSRIRDVLRALRATSETTQVILATHSPLVVNELKPDEVSVVTRPSTEVGTVVTAIKNTPNFEKRSSVYRLGELWLSYADGKDEADLLGTTPTAAQ